MVLSRIWSAFIIVAIVVASIKYIFSDNYKAIYNDLVVGKSGDTVQITKVPAKTLSAEIQKSLAEKPETEISRINYKKDSTNAVTVYRVQNADGVISTSKTAVEISLGLIGIMTLFMGFMSIAEKAGGINFFRELFSLFSLNYSQKFQKTILLLDT
jgi:spore maturation protein SpmA